MDGRSEPEARGDRQEGVRARRGVGQGQRRGGRLGGGDQGDEGESGQVRLRVHRPLEEPVQAGPGLAGGGGTAEEGERRRCRQRRLSGLPTFKFFLSYVKSKC